MFPPAVELKAYVFSSPAVAGDVVYLGVLNGTLEARDLATGELLWEYQTEASLQNRSWILTAGCHDWVALHRGTE